MKILIVDDSKAMRLIVKRTLTSAGYGGYTIVEATNGREALDSIKASQPDFVLSDWNMPEMSGIELLTALKSSNIKVPFAFVTTRRTCSQWQQRRTIPGACRYACSAPSGSTWPHPSQVIRAEVTSRANTSLSIPPIALPSTRIIVSSI